MFNALVIDKMPDYRASLQQLDASQLPAAEVVVDVEISPPPMDRRDTSLT